jgi:hypothetical protein
MLENGHYMVMYNIPSSGAGTVVIARFYDREMLWSDTINTSGYNNCITTDRDGNAYAAVSVLSEKYNLIIIKYDLSGRRLWEKGIGKTDWAEPKSIKFANQSVFIAGNTSGPLGGIAYGGWDGFISRFSTDGDSLWTKQLGENHYDEIKNMTVNPTGKVILCGFSYNYAYRANVIQVDTSGNYMTHEIGVGYNLGLVAGSLSDQTVLLAGISRGPDDSGEDKGFLTAIETNNNIRWTQYFGGKNIWEWPLDIKVNIGDEIYLATQYKDALMVLKYAPTGGLIWNRILWEERHDEFDRAEIHFDSEGNLIIYRISSGNVAIMRLSQTGSILS